MVGFYSEIIVRIAVFLYSLWIGGLATTIYNRIPNNIPIGPTQKPRCNNCKQEIKFKYFFPVLGYFFSNGKCIHCGMKIPRIYLFLELSILFYILVLSTIFNTFDEKFISTSLYGAFIITLMFIYKTHKQIKTRLIWMLITFTLARRGYNYNLPDVTDLFISGVASFLSFSILKKYVPLSVQEFKVCVITVTSFNCIASFAFLMVIMFIKTIYSLSFKIKLPINNTVVVLTPLIIALMTTFFH